MCLWRRAAVVTGLTATALCFSFGVGVMKMSNVHERMRRRLRASVHYWIRFPRQTTNSGRMKTGRP